VKANPLSDATVLGDNCGNTKHLGVGYPPRGGSKMRLDISRWNPGEKTMAGYLMIFGFQNENIYAISGK
jgi:hypothetical protein